MSNQKSFGQINMNSATTGNRSLKQMRDEKQNALKSQLRANMDDNRASLLSQGSQEASGMYYKSMGLNPAK